MDEQANFIRKLLASTGGDTKGGPENSLETQKKALPKFGKADGERNCLVVPTGQFHVKIGISMPNNFKGLDRKPSHV
jgi:hypothetical protein